LLALEDAAGIDADLAKQVGKIRSIAHQPAGVGTLTPRIDRGQPMMRSQGGELHPMIDERNIGINQEGIEAFLRYARQGRGATAVSPLGMATQLTRLRTRSAATSLSRLNSRSAQRYSIATSRPSTKPVWPKPLRNAATRWEFGSGEPG